MAPSHLLPPPARRFRCCPHAVCTAQGLLAKVGGYAQLGSRVPTPPTQRGQRKEGGWRCWGHLWQPCKSWSLSCVSRLHRHLQGFGGSSRPSAGRQRGTCHGGGPAPDGSMVHTTGSPACCPAPPPTARYPGALLTDEDAEGLRGSEVPREVPVPF